MSDAFAANLLFHDGPFVREDFLINQVAGYVTVTTNNIRWPRL
jgi:hypothetical protein